ncbi:hypothetical protein BEP19_12070 [Ammoniphilus oxalaticus]|uniref:Uncharacterized protein n=1 Tax=Ammoniphilus oxalaticus TaxID=66863 RepID=A0A419SGQ6_9BACL|nr:hypothetical protein [Ammoniphilus oxalaticus]RKD22960.1 hypothetical protein BEP19_12070 [Ammoniphilus oxalaticus]
MLNVTVGFVFTQVMFSDNQGKLQFHRVLTDVEKPWNSIFELLELICNALRSDGQQQSVYSLMNRLQIQVQYKTVHFDRLLGSLQEALSVAYENSQVTIHNSRGEALTPIKPIDNHAVDWIEAEEQQEQPKRPVLVAEQVTCAVTQLQPFQQQAIALFGNVSGDNTGRQQLVNGLLRTHRHPPAFITRSHRADQVVWGGFERGDPSLAC